MNQDSYKVAVCGDTRCGKSSLCLNLTNPYTIIDPFHYISTIGVDIMMLKIIPDIKLILYDYAGDVRFDVITSSYTRHCSLIIYVYSMDRLGTIDRLYRIREKHNRTLNMDDYHCIVIGTRRDTYNYKCMEEGINFANYYGIKHFEVSNTTKQGISDVIQYITNIFKKPEPVLEIEDISRPQSNMNKYITKYRQKLTNCTIL